MTATTRGTAARPPGDIDASVVRGLLHELRTPLNVLVGYADLLDDGSLEPAAHQRVSRIQNAASRLTGLLDLAADLARSVQGIPAPAPLPAEEALALAVDAVQADAAARRITIVHDGPHHPEPPSTGVPLAVRTLTCALTHAVHRSPGGATVHARTEGHDAVIETTAEIPDQTGTPPPGQAGQRFWWEAATLLAGATGATLRIEHPGTPGWRAIVTLPTA